ncbi:hypothetical protein F5878DRAFT_669535 [Lentinula raphanica]|uniref:Uncharacterized protein n=1 Tax=Lentinula raphanica TaxID=153919 RepID=A0AA38NXL4_9AGAR|nr:hypothetical protein F5878DRAFT_669535 [Lentinula raphanica]
MFTFQPARFSSPAKSTKRISSTANSEEDVSCFSHSSNIPELSGSSPKDVELIDTIIEQARPSTTTFLPVFKAYNNVLLKRELDPHGAKCYGELLKLGTLKGSSWQDKWDTIKAQNGYGSKPRAAELSTAQSCCLGITMKCDLWYSYTFSSGAFDNPQ